jgi:hypothetical protein
VLERLSIGIDIGGTKVAAGVVDVDGGLRELLHRETPSGSARDVEDTVASLVAELRRRHEVVAVGIGAAGFVDSARATVLFSPHLAWRHEPLRDAVHRRTGMSVVVENDANAAAWAEWRFGAAQNEPDLVCLTLGTGIGGALVGWVRPSTAVVRQPRPQRRAAAGGRRVRRTCSWCPTVIGTVRVRQPRLLGAVRQRQRAAAVPHGPSSRSRSGRREPAGRR